MSADQRIQRQNLHQKGHTFEIIRDWRDESEQTIECMRAKQPKTQGDFRRYGKKRIFEL